ncbi:MAG: carboxypeptidase-like regulatory domain-containing protein [Bacteroidota bacterium]
MKVNIRYLFSIVLMLGLVCQAWAQNNIQVTGKVTRKSTGEPLANATVSIKGTNTATTTNDAGSFTISMPQGGTLVVSYIGLAVTETVVQRAGEVNFSMEEGTAATLTDVVVVGYGQQRRAKLYRSYFYYQNKRTGTVTGSRSE